MLEKPVYKILKSYMQLKMQYFFLESVSKSKSEQKSAATEVDTDDGTDQISDTDIGDDDFIEHDEKAAECAQKEKKTKG